MQCHSRECRNVAITQYNGDLALYGLNGCARFGCPEGLNLAISELNDNREYIDDVQLTEQGRWLILYGDNGFRWNNISYSLEQKLRKYNDAVVAVYSKGYQTFGNIPTSLNEALRSTHLDVYRLKIAGPCWFFADKKGNYQYEM